MRDAGISLFAGSVQRRVVRIPSGENVRELGGFPTPEGSTRWHRFLRSGTTGSLTSRDLHYLSRYGVRYVADLRGDDELAHVPDPFADEPTISYINVPLYSCDLHDPKIESGLPEAIEQGAYGNFLVEGYLSMLANSAAMQRLFSFFAAASPDACILFHCTAGMDRTGVISMLLLALAGVDLEHIVADYAYSYTSVDEVDGWLFGDKVAPDTETNRISLRTMRVVCQQLLRAYGSVGGYLGSCGIPAEDVAHVRCHLLEP